ncbi:6-phosphofructokinase [Mycoplasmopsis lipofaciens]|uniref:6-phosphofructokinase n=1 Tax=Mycoplasmopsis lipofaciens TaxID=114884 RepID=UPI000A854388|nr:6-phosphofructokinase [Mycoplasmopsis lipofaciens]
MIKKIAILTSGGDAPGMNSAIRAIAKSARSEGLEAYLVFEGYKGLYYDKFINSTEIDLDYQNSRGGTCIYSSRFPEFKDPKVREVAINNLKKREIDALVVIGGDGSFRGAQLLHEAGIKTIGLPGTIDNDITSSDLTIGFDTALNVVVDAMDKIRDTASSQKRIVVVEIMGNKCGDLTLYGGLAAGAEIISTSENKLSIEQIYEDAKKITQTKNKDIRSIIIAVSEKMYDLKELVDKLSTIEGFDTRANVLGHIQRGGNPSAQERVLSSMFGMKAVECLLKNESGIVIGILNNEITTLPILEALSINRESRIKKAAELANKFNKLNKIK